MKAIEQWKTKAKHLKLETYTVYLASKDPRVPWYAKLLAVCIIAYAFSPIDLIPDFIPVLGYLDDLILIPLGIALLLKLIPESVLAECREKARDAMKQGKPTNWVAAVVIIAIWLLLAVLTVAWLRRLFR